MVEQRGSSTTLKKKKKKKTKVKRFQTMMTEADPKWGRNFRPERFFSWHPLFKGVKRRLSAASGGVPAPW